MMIGLGSRLNFGSGESEFQQRRERGFVCWGVSEAANQLSAICGVSRNDGEPWGASDCELSHFVHIACSYDFGTVIE